MSGLGKGITTASIGRLLKNRGYEVTAVKIDPYLNIDAGTMNPAQHGEVFVLSDGGEVDLDLGNYERFLDINLKSIHNITTGKVYQRVIERERRGDFSGATVQIIPHITDEIRHRIIRAAQEEINGGRKAEVCLVEVGGTVGDIESMPFLEAVRQMHAELAPQDMVLVHVTLVPMDAMGDLKTKPTQHSVKALRELGLQPDIIVCRGSEVIGPQTKKKISAFTDVPVKAVISAKDVPDIYQIPVELEKEGIAEVVCNYLAIENREADPAWYRVVSREYTNRVTVAIISKYGIEDVYMSIKESLKHAGRALSTEVNIRWLDAETLGPQDLADVDGILVPSGFGKRGVEGKIRAIRYARENKRPYLGISLGFQLAVVEYARHVLGIPDATSEEMEDGTHVIAIPGEEDASGAMHLGNCNVTLREGTMVAGLYGTTTTVERHRHRYEVNPEFARDLEDAGLAFTGFCEDRIEVCELTDHPFYLATQFHPEFRSSPTNPSPPYIGFVDACKKSRIYSGTGETPEW